jgi:hypothetical protein
MSEPDRSNLATRGDLFDAFNEFFDNLHASFVPDFVGRRVIVGPSSPVDLGVVFDGRPVECRDCVGGLICLRRDSGETRWYPLSRFAWIEMAD